MSDSEGVCQTPSYNCGMLEDGVMKSVSFRVGDALYEAMREAAAAENRTLSNWLATLCLQATADQQHGREPHEKPKR